MSAADNLKVILSFFDVNKFLDKIEIFRKLDLRTATDGELSRAIFDVLCIEFENAKMLVSFHDTRTIKKGTALFRVRKIAKDDNDLPLKGMSKKTDAWNPPKKVITKMGRLNKVGESLLYVSLDPHTAVKEMKLQENDRFSLIVYDVKKDIEAVGIGLGTSYEHYGLTEMEKIKARLIDRFLADEFSRDVGQGTEFLYRASEHIVKNYFELTPPDEQDAWMYPSIVSKQEYNLCFRPALAKKQLNLRGVVICEYIQGNIIGNYIAHGFNDNKIFNYYNIGSDMQKKVFPELVAKE